MPVILDICNSPGFGMVSGFGAYFMLISVQAKVNLIPYFTIDCYFLTNPDSPLLCIWYGPGIPSVPPCATLYGRSFFIAAASVEAVFSATAGMNEVASAVMRIRNVRFIGTLFLRVEVSCNEGNVVFAKTTLFIPKSKSFVTFLRIFPILGFFRGAGGGDVNAQRERRWGAPAAGIISGNESGQGLWYGTVLRRRRAWRLSSRGHG